MKAESAFLCYTGLLLFTTDVSAVITNVPLNTVTEVGQQAIFNCTSNIPNQQNWVFSAERDDLGTTNAQTIALSCVVQSGFTTDYEVDRPGGSINKCSLIVKATTLQQAGVYTCTDSSNGPSATLTVTERDSSIVVNNTSGVVAGEEVTMSYTIKYNTSTASPQTPTIQPVLTWTDSHGNVTSSSNTTGTNSITSNISVTAERQSIRPYTCGISYIILWPTPSTGLSFANNTPSSVPNPPRTQDVDVWYVPQIQSIRRSDETPLCPGDTVMLTCYATANPPATYSWIGPDSRNYTGATIPADMNGDYNCTASNVIRGSLHSETMKTTLNVCSHWLLLLLWSLNPISAAIFLICYQRSAPNARNDYNGRYPFLNRMLPCMNASEDAPCMIAAWLMLFIATVAFSGIQFLVLLIAAYAGCRNRAHWNTTCRAIVHIPCICVGGYILVNYIATVVFLFCYKRSRGLMDALNYRFPWLGEMLPCMSDNFACRCNWILFSAIVFTLVGTLFIISIIVIEKCSQRRKRSQASAQQFQNTSDITDGNENLEMKNNQNGPFGANGDETYDQIDAKTYAVSLKSKSNGKDIMQQNGTNKGKSKSAEKKKNHPPPPFDGDVNSGGNISNPMFDNPTSPPPNPQNESAQLQQPPTAPGTVYSDLPIISLNIQPKQYLEGNTDNPTYSELNKA